MLCIFGPTVASTIVNGCLGINSFFVGKPLFQGRSRLVCFCAGQPLGYYGSWALFSLSHHFVVWLAAKFAYPHLRRPFWNYAILGDDIVIADEAVATEYVDLVGRLGVSISKPKSLVSDVGALEFAKQYWKGNKNLSQV